MYFMIKDENFFDKCMKIKILNLHIKKISKS